MKKLLMIVVVLALAVSSAMAQDSNLKKFFDGQHKKKGVTQITLNGNISVTDEDSKTDIKGIKVLTCEAGEAEMSSHEFMAEAVKALEKDGYMQIMSMNHENEKMGIYLLNDEEGDNSGTAITVYESGEAVITWLEGKIDFSEMANVMNDCHLDINLDGFDINEY